MNDAASGQGSAACMANMEWNGLPRASHRLVERSVRQRVEQHVDADG